MPTSPFDRVTVLGLGVLGAQIALQIAAHGVEVTSYDIDDAALAAGRGRLDGSAPPDQPDRQGKTPAAAGAGVRSR